MDVNVLDEVQASYSIFNGLGEIAGNYAIIKGCEITGTTVNDGLVYINGELLEFRQNGIADKVIIVQEAETKEFENGTEKEVIYRRYATFGSATVSYDWSNFKRLDPITQLMARMQVLEKKAAVFQQGGGMVLWNKPANEIPAGWVEVLDWRGRMPVGYHPTDAYTISGVITKPFDAIGKMGGDKTRSLTSTNNGPHTHDYHDIYYSEVNGNVYVGGFGSGDSDGDNGGYQLLRTSFSSGNGTPFPILNPYRVVLFIEYIG